ncbi:hypothetical protein L210DRAFT_3588163, partial [Boletus edulis BED1]
YILSFVVCLRFVVLPQPRQPSTFDGLSLPSSNDGDRSCVCTHDEGHTNFNYLFRKPQSLNDTSPYLIAARSRDRNCSYL